MILSIVSTILGMVFGGILVIKGMKNDDFTMMGVGLILLKVS